MSTLEIAVDNSTKTWIFSMTKGPAGATVDRDGNIDVSQCPETDIDIQWTLATETFRTPGKAVTIAGNGNNQIFGNPILTNQNKTCTVRDSNPATSSNKNFRYTIHVNKGQHDPTIRNR